jgi:hypothetical protein
MVFALDFGSESSDSDYESGYELPEQGLRPRRAGNATYLFIVDGGRQHQACGGSVMCHMFPRRPHTPSILEMRVESTMPHGMSKRRGSPGVVRARMGEVMILGLIP